MRESRYVFTSESVTEGHPDKLCDRMSDAIVGRYLLADPTARVAAECAVSTGIVFVSVKLCSRARVDLTSLVRDVIRRTGYARAELDARTCTVMTTIHELSDGRVVRREDDHARGIDATVAEDQATVFGFACTQTPALIPLPIWLAHKLARGLSRARRAALPYLSADGKTQVAVELRGGRPSRIFGVTVIARPGTSDAPGRSVVERDVRQHVIEPAFEDEGLKPDGETRIIVNPDGLSMGGPAMHAGLTGRKTAVDTYGEFARHSGAALSGKDIGRIDRIGAYAARYVAKNVVAAGLAEECEVQLSYSIGAARPVSVHVETFGTGEVADEEIERRIDRTFDLRVGAISDDLHLLELAREGNGSAFEKLAAYGHVGRTDLPLGWEKTDRAGQLQS